MPWLLVSISKTPNNATENSALLSPIRDYLILDPNSGVSGNSFASMQPMHPVYNNANNSYDMESRRFAKPTDLSSIPHREIKSSRGRRKNEDKNDVVHSFSHVKQHR